MIGSGEVWRIRRSCWPDPDGTQTGLRCAAYVDLRANKLFAGLNDVAVAECTAQFTPLRVRKSRALFRQGDEGRQVCLVLDGFVRIGRLTEDGRDLTVRIISRGDFLGEGVLFADTTRSSSATALDDCKIAVCRADSLAALLMRHPQLSLNI